MTRNLYIVQGSHFLEGLPEEQIDIVTRYVEVREDVIKRLARKYGVTHYFADGIERSPSFMRNEYEIIEQLDERSEEEVKRQLDLAEKHKLKKPWYYGHMRDFMLFYELRKQGIPILPYGTEREDFDNPEVLLQEAAQTNQGAQDLLDRGEDAIRLVSIHGNPYCIQLRDEAVYDNVCEQAGKESILYMGRNHPLDLFSYGEHDFTIYRLIIGDDQEEENLITITAELPSDFQADFDMVRGKFPHLMVDTIHWK